MSHRVVTYLHVADLVSDGRALAAGYGVAAAQLEDGATIAGPGTLTPGGPGGPQGGVVLLLHRTLPEWMCRHILHHMFFLVQIKTGWKLDLHNGSSTQSKRNLLCLQKIGFFNLDCV